MSDEMRPEGRREAGELARMLHLSGLHACTVTVHEGIAVLTADASHLDATTRLAVVGLARRQGFTHVALELP